jgi:hypothetical protein
MEAKYTKIRQLKQIFVTAGKVNLNGDLLMIKKAAFFGGSFRNVFIDIEYKLV